MEFTPSRAQFQPRRDLPFAWVYRPETTGFVQLPQINGHMESRRKAR